MPPGDMAKLTPEVRAFVQALQAQNQAKDIALADMARQLQERGANGTGAIPAAIPDAARPAIAAPPPKKARSGKSPNGAGAGGAVGTEDEFESDDDSAPPSDAGTESDTEWNEVGPLLSETNEALPLQVRARIVLLFFARERPSHPALNWLNGAWFL